MYRPTIVIVIYVAYNIHEMSDSWFNLNERISALLAIAYVYLAGAHHWET